MTRFQLGRRLRMGNRDEEQLWIRRSYWLCVTSRHGLVSPLYQVGHLTSPGRTKTSTASSSSNGQPGKIMEFSHPSRVESNANAEGKNIGETNENNNNITSNTQRNEPVSVRPSSRLKPGQDGPQPEPKIDVVRTGTPPLAVAVAVAVAMKIRKDEMNSTLCRYFGQAGWCPPDSYWEAVEFFLILDFFLFDSMLSRSMETFCSTEWWMDGQHQKLKKTFGLHHHHQKSTLAKSAIDKPGRRSRQRQQI
ncbi:hypothetical protein V8F20_010513 [Naviculisporaceae sp. PSN 640]